MKVKKRKAGILLPISSIPSPYGIGTLGKAALEFVDFLKKAGQSLWQILPVGPTGYGDSPYQSFSTFAGNPYFIDLEELVSQGYLTKEECDETALDLDQQYVNYEKQFKERYQLLKKAYEGFTKQQGDKTKEYRSFCQEESYWLEDYALFMAVKNLYEGKGFREWDTDIRLHEQKAIESYKRKCASDYNFYIFLQYEFKRQWMALKFYANQNGIKIIGDIPIYVAADSADVWANPKLFQLDKDGIPTGVAGCPPDYFCKTGQLWGNPLYDWEYHKSTGYEWWTNRISYCYELYDVIRIDHFRGFDEYYDVPYGDATAEFGSWRKGPGMNLFQTLKEKIGKMDVIAEDLGFLTPSVEKMVKNSGYPGMKVLQFAFDPEGDSTYLPHNYTRNCVVYTGTHDNDTALGSYKSMGRKEKQFAREYLSIKNIKDVNWAYIRAALASISDIAIIPMQDYLGLGAEARINTPSTLGDNWKWRMTKEQYNDELAVKIQNACFVYARCENGSFN